jgi:hypothetical protein
MLDLNSEMSKPDRPEVPEELQRKAGKIPLFTSINKQN